MANSDTKDADAPAVPPFPTPSLEDMQHWTWVMGRAQQLMMEHLSQQKGAAAT
jgi:polyhydroxyalkanoate synthase